MKKILKMIGVIAIYGAAYLIANIIAAMPVVIIAVFKIISQSRGAMIDPNGAVNTYTDVITKYTTLLVILGDILSLVLFYTILLVRKKKVPEILHFRKFSLKSAALIVVAAVGLYFTISYLTNIFMGIAPQFVPGYEDVAKALMGGNIITTVLCVAVVAPVFEEILLRGLILGELRANMPLVPAVIIQAVLFGLLHGNVIQGSYAFVLGIILALAYIWTKSLWAPMVLHIVFNSSSLLTDKLLQGAIDNNSILIYFIIGTAVAIISLVFLWRNRVLESPAPKAIEVSE